MNSDQLAGGTERDTRVQHGAAVAIYAAAGYLYWSWELTQTEMGIALLSVLLGAVIGSQLMMLSIEEVI